MNRASPPASTGRYSFAHPTDPTAPRFEVAAIEGGVRLVFDIADAGFFQRAAERSRETRVMSLGPLKGKALTDAELVAGWDYWRGIVAGNLDEAAAKIAEGLKPIAATMLKSIVELVALAALDMTQPTRDELR